MEIRQWRNFDVILLFSSILLACFGVLMIYSTSQTGTAPNFAVALQQGGYVLIGLLLLPIVTTVDYRIYTSFAYPIYGVTLFLLAIVLYIGHVTFGAQRWIPLGSFTFQPSEMAKLVVVIVLAKFFSARQDKLGSIWTLLGSLLILLPVVVLVYRQPDLGTTIVIVAIWIGMVIMAGIPLRLLSGLLVLGALISPILWKTTQQYQRDRLSIFLHPETDPTGQGYNIIQSRISVGSGGWFGSGFLQGAQTQLNFLKVARTDFIFSSIAEQFGLVGELVLFIIIAVLLWRGLRITEMARDSFGRLLGAGIVTMLLVEAFINVGMNIGLMPVTGIPLPFISAGGSSLLTTLVSIGVLESIIVRHKKIDF